MSTNLNRPQLYREQIEFLSKFWKLLGQQIIDLGLQPSFESVKLVFDPSSGLVNNSLGPCSHRVNQRVYLFEPFCIEQK